MFADPGLQHRIVYEDNHIMVVNKLPSEIVQGDKTGDEPMSEKIKRFIKERDSKPGNVFCGVIHRLDRPVSGLVIFAKTSKGLSRFNELIRERGVSKEYLAVVKTRPVNEEGRLTHYLIKNERNNLSKAYDREVKGALKAELEYRLLASSDNYHLLWINLLTGRHHQIRCQLGAVGCPIKGDVKYGFNRPNEGGYIHLHSYSLNFVHPVSKKEIFLQEWPVTDDKVWMFFRERLKDHLRK